MQLEPMDAVVVRALIDATRSQTRATLQLVEVIRTLSDKVDALRGVKPDERPSMFSVPGAMGENGR